MRFSIIVSTLASVAAFSPRTPFYGLHSPVSRRTVAQAMGPNPLPRKADGPNPDLPDGSTAPGVAALLEKTFVLSCLQAPSGYVDMLKLFIAAAIAGYEQAFTVPCLQLELSQVETQTANRPLAQEEVELRSLWLSLVYMTLQQVYHPTRSITEEATGSAGVSAEAVAESVPSEIRQKFNTFVYDCVNARQGGWTLQTLKLEELMKSSGGNSAAPDMTDPMEKAILGQSMRIVFLTLQCLDDANLASGKSVPKPNIPGV